MAKFVMLFILYVLFLRKAYGFWWRRRETTTKALTTTIKTTTSIHATFTTPIDTVMTATHATKTPHVLTDMTSASSCLDSCKREDDSCDTGKRKCVHVTDTTKIPSQCLAYLKKSCVSEEAISEIDLTPFISNTTLLAIFNSIDDKNHDCRNRSIELICHGVLPLCSFELNNCEEVTCNQPKLKPSCQDYCLNLTNSCYSDESNLVNKIFKEVFNMTITEACETLPIDQCWKPNADNECIVSDTTNSSTILPKQTLQPGSKEDLNASNNTVAIIVPSIGGVIILLLIAILVYRCFKRNAKHSNQQATANEIDDKELVYNVLYKSVNPRNPNESTHTNSTYENPDKLFEKNENEVTYENTKPQSENEEKIEVKYSQVIKPKKKKLAESEGSIYSLAQN